MESLLDGSWIDHGSEEDPSRMEKVLHRTTFATRRLLEFFSEPELTMQIGPRPGSLGHGDPQTADR